jgi:hypothetical protein
MDKPDPVSLVIPPNNTCISNIATPKKIHFATILVDLSWCIFLFAIHIKSSINAIAAAKLMVK